ncbi:MAG: hypothetical protein Q9170_002255 [Blastenia crenularia]
MAAAQLKKVQDSGQLKRLVEMDDYDIVIFGRERKTCLATEDLNSCHAVIIVSKKAAVLAHIAPHAPAEIRHQYPTALHWTQTMIDRVVSCVQANKSHFEDPGSGGIVVYGVYQGEIALPDQVKLLAANIEKVLRLQARPFRYQVPGTPGPNKGIVIIEGDPMGQSPTLWVEEYKIVLTAGSASTASGSTGSSKPASTAFG